MMFLAGCTQKGDEEGQLQDTLTDIQSQLEAREAKKVMQHLDRDFLAQGRYQSIQLGQMMALHFQQNQQIYVFLKNTKIQMHYPKADVVTTAYVLGSKNVIPERGQRYEVKMRWLKVKDKWKLSRLNWQRSKDN
jgi:hypothetical protein